MGPCRLYLILMADGQRCSFFQLLTCNLSRTFGIKLEYEYNINIINHHNISLFPNSYLLIFIRSVISCCECGAGLWRSTGVCGAGVCPVLGMPPPVSSWCLTIVPNSCLFYMGFSYFYKNGFKVFIYKIYK